MRADVVELLDHHRAVLMAGVGDAAKVRDHAVVAVAEVASGEDRGRWTGTGSTTIMAAPPTARSR